MCFEEFINGIKELLKTLEQLTKKTVYLAKSMLMEVSESNELLK